MTDNILANVAITRQNRPATHDRAIYFCVDKGFYPYAMFVADQIVRKCAQRDFDICILSADDLPEDPLWSKNNLRVCQIDTGDLASRVPSDARISFAAYLRIMAPTLFQGDYRRMLYLDADFFYQRGDLSRLLDLDLGGHAIGAVRDMIQLRKRDRVPEDFRPFALPHAKYFNSGLLLIDVATWLEHQIGERAIIFAAENASKVLAHDQTALNVTLQGDWAELPLVWNFEYSHQTMYFSAFFDVCFYHFIGRRKPFNQRYGGFPRRFTEEYRLFFEQHFTDRLPLIQQGLDIENQWKKHIYALIFHMVNVKRFLHNDDRALNDWDVR